jgi:hypothetical protein
MGDKRGLDGSWFCDTRPLGSELVRYRDLPTSTPNPKHKQTAFIWRGFSIYC